MADKTNILIATPAYGRQVTIDYLLSIRNLEAAFRSNNIGSQLGLTFGSVLPRSRAALASIVLHDEAFSHLLFVDSDMGFRPSAVLKLLRAGKEFSGCIYPSRHINFRALHNASRHYADYEAARHAGLKYVGLDGVLKDQGAAGDLEGFRRTTRLGLGLTLISRSVLLKMRDALPELMLAGGLDPAYVEMGAKNDILQAFEAIQLPTGLFLGEDLSFCHRWIHACGGEIWACIDEEVSHVGHNPVAGRAADFLALSHDADRKS